MREVNVISQEVGPHPGWCRQDFVVGSKRWQLFTIDRPEEKRSSILEVDVHGHPCSTASTVHVDCLLTPNAAYEILIKLNGARAEAYERGRNDLRRELKELLNISR